MLLLLLLFLGSFHGCSSQSIVRSLPGYDGDLPFYFETGYIGVGEQEEVQLFYYFAASENRPEDDPLLLWLTGGPGCSALSGLIYEVGPFTFDLKAPHTYPPKLVLNPYSWTKVSSMIFVDAPVGTGFSYSTTQQGYDSSATKESMDLYEFMRKWLQTHPKFSTNPLYISGDSYSGIIVPMVAYHISNGNMEGLFPRMNLQGYTVGNPMTLADSDINSRVEYAFYKSLLSIELYESARHHCNGDYINVNQGNAACIDDLKLINKCLENIFIGMILEPDCATLSPEPRRLLRRELGSSRDEDFLNFTLKPRDHITWCRSYNYLAIYIWANDESVQDALHIRMGTVPKWTRCNYSISFSENVNDTVDYHRQLLRRGYRGLVYSGDHDMVFPYLGTLKWIGLLNLSITSEWQPWTVDGQVAGYTIKYNDTVSQLVFATVLGAGHTAPEYNPKQCLAMIRRWLAHFPLTSHL
ncbi:hypothetical protein MLD38_032420 [Melastoma candidum]|uniref:Uncharacterized protein n=1 Tax=Melastoma candidum TaxID=119954 RepID=A0ACB9M4U2_9MYRT|nr:hypothetical protein MLD38_032420 [Melastoma candidum]